MPTEWKKGSVFIDEKGDGWIIYYGIISPIKPKVTIYQEDDDPIRVYREVEMLFFVLRTKGLDDAFKETLPPQFELNSRSSYEVLKAFMKALAEDEEEERQIYNSIKAYDTRSVARTIEVAIDGSLDPDENSNLRRAIELMKDIDLDQLAKEVCDYTLLIAGKLHLLGADPSNYLINNLITQKCWDLLGKKQDAIRELIPSP